MCLSHFSLILSLSLSLSHTHTHAHRYYPPRAEGQAWVGRSDDQEKQWLQQEEASEAFLRGRFRACLPPARHERRKLYADLLASASAVHALVAPRRVGCGAGEAAGHGDGDGSWDEVGFSDSSESGLDYSGAFLVDKGADWGLEAREGGSVTGEGAAKRVETLRVADPHLPPLTNFQRLSLQWAGVCAAC